MMIEELAKRKVQIQQTLEAMMMMNAYGHSLDEMAEFEMQRIALSRELWSIEAQIRGYIQGANEPSKAD